MPRWSTSTLAGGGADEHDVHAVDLAGERVGGHFLQDRERVGSGRQRGKGAVQFPQQLRGAERRVPGLHLGHGDADRPLGLRLGELGGRRVARAVLGHGGVQVGQDLNPGAAGVLLPRRQPLGAGGRVLLLGLAGGAGQVLPPLPPGPRRRLPAVQPPVLGFLLRERGVDLPARPRRERVHGGLLDPADLERVAVFLLGQRDAQQGQLAGEDPLGGGAQPELLIPQRLAVQRPPLTVPDASWSARTARLSSTV